MERKWISGSMGWQSEPEHGAVGNDRCEKDKNNRALYLASGTGQGKELPKD